MMSGAAILSRCARALVAVVAVTAGCSRNAARPAWNELDLAARHAQVDHLLDEGKADQARSALEQLFAALKTARAVNAPGGRQAMQDVAYRLGNLALERKDQAAALAYCNQGLSLGIAQDLFSANLLVLRGTAREELHQSAEAGADLHQALLINEALLARALP